jgi:hypothetical protein
MDLTMATEVPELVVHTTVAKKPDENAGILDGIWACLLNDYLDNLGDTEDEESDTSSDTNSMSTAALRAERRRLRHQKKRERRKELMKGLLKDMSDPSFILEDSSAAVDRQLLHHLESDAYSKGDLLDVASRSFDTTIKSKESRDNHGPLSKTLMTLAEEIPKSQTLASNNEVKLVSGRAALHKSAKTMDMDDVISRSHRN